MKPTHAPAPLRTLIVILLIASIGEAPGCGSSQQSSISMGTAIGLDPAGMDPSVSPGDDFHAYATGGWATSGGKPGGRIDVAAETRKRTLAILQEAAAATAGDTRKIGDFYASFMNEAAIESKGVRPLQAQLDAISAIADRQALARVLGEHLRADVDPLNNTNFQTGNLFGIWVTQGLADPSRTFPYLLQGGLGMPGRDYYLSAAPEMMELQKRYQSHIAATFRLAGYPDPAVRAARVYGLEKKMALAHATLAESKDVSRVVSWKRENLGVQAPGLDWTALLEAAGLADVPVFLIWQPRAVTRLSALAAAEPLDAWKDWLVFHEVEHAANFLPQAFVEEYYSFHDDALNGPSERLPRWQRGVDMTNAALGNAVGRLYVARYFPPETRRQVETMVDDLVKAFDQRIGALPWMSPETKARAKQKLMALKVGVGYPERWVDYDALEILKGDALGNARRAELFEYRRQLAKLRQPVDRTEWWLAPQTLNAMNLPLQNALTFPAAILQPPFYDPGADAAHNYGSIGAIIGHEISHGFDDRGSQFDAAGRLANWWLKEDAERFHASGEALVQQFNSYQPFADLSVNGRQTLGENIADLAGLLVAYDAYRLSLKGKADVEKGHLSGDQRFFISFGQLWRARMSEAALRTEIATDNHAPERYRADTVRNLDPWYDAFSVQSARKLFLAPQNRVRIW